MSEQYASEVSDDRAAIDDEIRRLEGDMNGDVQAGPYAEVFPDEPRSIEQMAADEPPEDEGGQTLLDFGDQLNLSVKGSRPTDSEIRIRAISRPIKGQLGDSSEDEVITVLVTARLDELRIVTKRDGQGLTAAKTRRHVLTPIAVAPVSREQAEALLSGSA